MVPDVPASVGAYASELEALKYLVGYSLAMALPLARIEVGAVAVTFAPAGPRPGTVTNIGGGEPVDLYRTFGGRLYDQLQAQVREAVETPR